MNQLPAYEDFHFLFNEIIKKELLAIEKMRRQIIINYSIIGFVLFAGFVVETITWMLLGILFIVVFIILYTRYYGINFSDFKKAHQKAILPFAAKYIHPDMVYDHNRYIKLKQLNGNLLFSTENINYGGKNFIQFPYNSFTIDVSEINAGKKGKNEKGLATDISYVSGLVSIGNAGWDYTDEIVILSDQALLKELVHLPGRKFINNAELLISYSDENIYMKIVGGDVLLEIKSFIDFTNDSVQLTINPSGVYIYINYKGDHLIPSSLFKNAINNKISEKCFWRLLFINRLNIMIHRRLGIAF